MPKIIKNDRIIDDAWEIIRISEGQAPESISLADTSTLYPLAVWRALRDRILATNQPAGVWLQSVENIESLAGDLDRIAVIAIDFPKFTDGRGYSAARLLRERYGYQGEIRAIGDVLRDQLFFMKRCGFNAFAVKNGKDIEDALAGLRDFSETYQGAVDQPQPLFRRRTA